VRIATVVGRVVSTVKQQPIDGFTLLLVTDLDPTDPEATDVRPYVALDLAGAGEGEVVLVATGSAARVPGRTTDVPTDAAVVGIVDSVVSRGEVLFTKD
jgi:ethanolamine utilization protein EutN